MHNFKQILTSNQRPGVFSIPALGHPGENLDQLLLSLDSLWMASEAESLPKDLLRLKRASIYLDQHFVLWQGSRAAEFKPTTIGTIGQSNSYSPPGAGCWPGKVDTYFDLYVAGVWNVFRVARLLIVALIIKLSEASEENEDCSEYIRTVNCIVDDVISSVPYHLTDNLQVFLGTSSLNKEIMDSGKFLGGLLLIHPLYIVSELPFVSGDMRDYMRTCLAWIGSEMGFGQATLLSNVRETLQPIAGIADRQLLRLPILIETFWRVGGC
jgi:hypothetical protein